jgi:hypothetical protein
MKFLPIAGFAAIALAAAPLAAFANSELPNLYLACGHNDHYVGVEFSPREPDPFRVYPGFKSATYKASFFPAHQLVSVSAGPYVLRHTKDVRPSLSPTGRSGWQLSITGSAHPVIYSCDYKE